MGDLVVAVGAITVILGGLLLGFASNKGHWRNISLTCGWLMVIFGLGAESAAIVQAARSGTPSADASSQ